MAGFTTHYIFGIEEFHKLNNKKIMNIIKEHKAVFNLGLQGPDLFFFNPICMIERKHNYGNLIHKNKVNIFFKNALLYLENINNISDKKIIKSYICGFMGHYSLDIHFHPYIYYRSGYSIEQKNSKESFELHSFIELNVDIKYLNDKKYKKPSEFYQSRTICITKNEHKQIINLLSYCIFRTYFFDIKNNMIKKWLIHKRVSFSIHSMRVALYLLHDNNGTKRKIIQWLEKHLIGFVIVSNIIATDTLKDPIDCMNESHKPWCHLWKKEEKSTESFDMLYKKAGRYYQNLINIFLNDYKKNIEEPVIYYKDKQTRNRREEQIIKKYNTTFNYLGNRSYQTGIDCDLL